MNSISDDFIVFGRPEILTAEIEEVEACLKSAWLGTGPRVAQFESSFADYKNVSDDRVAAVNSCTAALHISMIAAGLSSGDEVITTPLTFCSTVNAIIHSGATPVLADVDSVTMNISPSEIKKAITERTKAIVPVHFAGRPCEMDKIMAIASEFNLKVIEDCAHSIEGEFKGKKCGTIGDFGCFSFYVTKNVVTGEGGMIVAKNSTDIERAKVLALHGMTKDAWHRFSDSGYKHYQVVECGFKYNMMDIQAAIGIHQLARADINWQKRKRIWNLYRNSFRDLPLILPSEPAEDTRHACHLFTPAVDPARTSLTRDEVLDSLTELGIGTGVHYLSIPEHPYYRSRFGWEPETWPVAKTIGRTTFSLPLGTSLTDSQVNRVIRSVKSVFDLNG
jgi:dTDP-4-amino-4,6-dideoxygalactose transaminase